MASMNSKLPKWQETDDLSKLGGGEAVNEVTGLKRDLEGWREVLIPLTRLLRWEQPYFPAVIIGLTSLLFLIVWFTDMSAVTAISLVLMLIGIVDFLVPFIGPKITGYTTWTVTEEQQFSEICEKIADIRQNVIDMCRGLSSMRQLNAKVFFLVTMGVLAVTAWIGNLVDNLFLTYLIVTATLLLPGLTYHQIAHKYLQPVMRAMDKLKDAAPKVKIS